MILIRDTRDTSFSFLPLWDCVNKLLDVRRTRKRQGFKQLQYLLELPWRSCARQPHWGRLFNKLTCSCQITLWMQILASALRLGEEIHSAREKAEYTFLMGHERRGRGIKKNQICLLARQKSSNFVSEPGSCLSCQMHWMNLSTGID